MSFLNETIRNIGACDLMSGMHGTFGTNILQAHEFSERESKRLTYVCLQWSIVLAGISDFYRPAESLSLTQNAALTATGLIWTRWCLIIKPRNIL